MLIRAQRQAWQAEADFLQLAIATADARKSVRTKQLKIARTRLDAYQAWSDRLSNRINQLRADSLKQQEAAIRAAAREAKGQSPVLSRLAVSNQELLNRRKDLAEQIHRIGLRHDYYQEKADWINRRLAEIQQRVKISGFSQAAAELMLKELRRLPKMGELEGEQIRLEKEVRTTQLEMVDLSDALTEQLEAESQLRELGIDLTPDEVIWLHDHEGSPILDDLLHQARIINEYLRNDTNKYFDLLLATDSEIMATIQATEGFREYTSENILWIPSRDTLSARDITAMPNLMDSVVQEFTSVLDRIIKGPVLRAIAFCLLVMLIAIVLRIAAKYTRKDRIAPVNPQSFAGTAKLLLFEVGVAVTPVFILHLFSWALNDPQLNGSFSSAVEYVSLSIGPATFFLMLLYRITLPAGLARNHLRWPDFVCRRINIAVSRFLLPALIFGTLSITFDQYALITDQTSGSRLFMLPSFLFCLLALHTVFAPNSGILRRDPTSGLKVGPVARWAVYLSVTGWQGLLCLLVVGGYMLGAVMLWTHTFRSLWLVASVIILKGIVIRYLEVQHWNALQQEQEEQAKGELSEIDKPSSYELDDSTRQVISFLQWVILMLGISAIWSDAFPSLRKLGEAPAIQFGDDVILNWGQGGMLLICVVTTVLLARSLPRLLEILVLRRIASIDPGSRHAFSTLVAYLVVVIGIIWASSILRIQWDEIQWLVAAISVGLGFGLQEIFGNLVAGIILLFERPIRVGDIVTVGQTTGKVTRIQMRGTTIMEWDRRELIVPNKEFVTGQLTNWTLSDTLTRLTLNVGVAYGSDIGQVKELLLETIKRDHRVLEDPAPAVFFKEFGESSLDFIGFAYLGTLDDRLGTSSDLQQAIYEALKAANIRIPFPQRDLHIINSSPQLYPTQKAE